MEIIHLLLLAIMVIFLHLRMELDGLQTHGMMLFIAMTDSLPLVVIM